MGNLDAMMQSLAIHQRGSESRYASFDDLRRILRAYHGEQAKPTKHEAALNEFAKRAAANMRELYKVRSDWKVEAGAEVEGNGYHGIVVARRGPVTWVQCQMGVHTVATCHLSVTEPATPEVGDYVQLSDGRTGQVAWEEEPGRLWRVRWTAGGSTNFGRADFTIICKGTHHA